MKTIFVTLVLSTTIITMNAQNKNSLLNEWKGNYGGVPAFDQYKVSDMKEA